MPYLDIPSLSYRNFRKFGTQVIFYDQDQEPGTNASLDSFFNSTLPHTIPLPRPATSLIITYTFFNSALPHSFPLPHPGSPFNFSYYKLHVSDPFCNQSLPTTPNTLNPSSRELSSRWIHSHSYTATFLSGIYTQVLHVPRHYYLISSLSLQSHQPTLFASAIVAMSNHDYPNHGRSFRPSPTGGNSHGGSSYSRQGRTILPPLTIALAENPQPLTGS